MSKNTGFPAQGIKCYMKCRPKVIMTFQLGFIDGRENKTATVIWHVLILVRLFICEDGGICSSSLCFLSITLWEEKVTANKFLKKFAPLNVECL